MKKFIKFLSLLSMVVMLGGMITSCRGNSAKKTVDIVKKYSGKVFKNSEKNALMLRHGDDVVRHINFQKVLCSDCGGDGETWSGTCETCSGDGYVYVIKSR